MLARVPRLEPRRTDPAIGQTEPGEDTFLGRLPLVEGVDALGHVDLDGAAQLRQPLGQRFEGGVHRLGEGLDLFQHSLGLATDDPGHRLVEDLAPGEPRRQRDLGRLQGQRLAGGVDGPLGVGK